MHSTKLVTCLLLAASLLTATAHRLTPAGHHAAASKHQPNATHRKRTKTKQVVKASKSRKTIEQLPAASRRHLAKHKVASHKQRAAQAKQHTTKRVAVAPHRPATHRAALQSVGRTYRVTATVYQAVPGQTDGSPFVTADNSRIKPRYGSHTRWLALSPDLLQQGGGRFHYGDKVQVSRVSPQLDGVYTVHDTMNRRHRRRIDILTHRREKLSVFAPDAKLRLAPAPRKSRAQATAVAHARPGRGNHARAASLRSRASGKRATYLASAIL
jgi:3D (Asp-Asp-Asp) domain-containing protein